MKNIILFLISFSFLISDINISGDARFRPRYDIKENGDGSSTADLYYLYRARLNMKANIGEGWFLNTKLGTGSVAGMTIMGLSDGSESGNINSYRPNVSFMELYFGYMNDNCGFWAGVFPLKYNSSLDLHFYSDKLVDIPFVLFNNSSTTGLAGYQVLMGRKLNWFLSVDNNNIDTEETIEEINYMITPAFCSDESFLTQAACEGNGFIWNPENTTQEIVPALETTINDGYTLGMDMLLNFGLLSLNPRVLTSFGGSEDNIFPMTYGTDILLPEILGFSSGLSYYLSIKGEDTDQEYYKADHMRISISKPIKNGKLKFFYDAASKNTEKVSYMWFSYTHACYKGEMGEVTISPTFRLQNGKDAGSDTFDKDYSRAKFELTTQIKFK